ncbi:MAG TPA: hypothetical protein VFU07_05340 [Candidatus Lumbricidophila sp.]|nr:hypothetical protein [Candidatus Lumbricidophila sp.]
MPFTITDQKPAVLDPIHLIPINNPYDPAQAMHDVLVAPFFEPLPGRKVTIVDHKNRTQDQASILNQFYKALTETVDHKAQTNIKSLLQQGLVNYDAASTLLVNELFAVQAAALSKLPSPSPRVIYSAGSDVIPSAKALLSGNGDQQQFLATLAYTYSPETLGFWFLTESAYEDFRAWFATQVNALSGALPADTLQMLQKFQLLKLPGLTESLILRKDDNDQLQEYSFARVLVHLLMQYSAIQKANLGNQAGAISESGVLPFVVTELFLPRTVVLVNVEAHARATNRKVDAEWKLINMALSAPVKVVSTNALSKLTALPRAMAKASAAAAQATTQRNQHTGRSAKIKFRKQAPTSVDILTGLTRVLKRMKEVNRSQNVFKRTQSSFVKANRRDPMDYNKAGKSVSTHYLPDLHVYVDTSGSISEINYQQSVIMLIKLAKKLNVNLYFNSFSNVMSQQILLRTSGKSTSQIWKEFQRIPKVAGGTDYEQIWHYINQSKVRKERLSLIISDFEWRARSQRIEHPKNLYYAPCGHMNWDRMVAHAEGFAKSVQHLEPAIAQHLIGIVV